MRNHLARQAFNEIGYNRFPARAKLHNRDQSNSGSPATRRHAAQMRRLINQNIPGHRGMNVNGENQWGTNE